MIHPYDSAVQMPNMDLYDTNMMQLYINAVQREYERGLQDQKEFLSKYGDFFSPFAKDVQNWDMNIMGPVMDMVDAFYKQGIDPARNPEARAMLQAQMRRIPYGEAAKMRYNAKMGEEYLKNRGAMAAKGLYDPDRELFALQQAGLTPFEQWDSSKGMWTRTSPSQYKSLFDITSPWFEGIKPYELTKEQVEAFPGYKYDPRYKWMGVGRDKLLETTESQIPGWMGSEDAAYFRELARRELQLLGNNNPTEQQVIDRLKENIINANSNRIVRPSTDADPYAMLAAKDQYDARSQARAYQYDIAKYDYERAHPKTTGRTRTDSNGNLVYDDEFNLPTYTQMAEQGAAVKEAVSNVSNVQKDIDGIIRYWKNQATPKKDLQKPTLPSNGMLGKTLTSEALTQYRKDLQEYQSNLQRNNAKVAEAKKHVQWWEEAKKDPFNPKYGLFTQNGVSTARMQNAVRYSQIHVRGSVRGGDYIYRRGSNDNLGQYNLTIAQNRFVQGGQNKKDANYSNAHIFVPLSEYTYTPIHRAKVSGTMNKTERDTMVLFDKWLKSGHAGEGAFVNKNVGRKVYRNPNTGMNNWDYYGKLTITKDQFDNFIEFAKKTHPGLTLNKLAKYLGIELYNKKNLQLKSTSEGKVNIEDVQYVRIPVTRVTQPTAYDLYDDNVSYGKSTIGQTKNYDEIPNELSTAGGTNY